MNMICGVTGAYSSAQHRQRALDHSGGARFDLILALSTGNVDRAVVERPVAGAAGGKYVALLGGSRSYAGRKPQRDPG